MRKPFRQLRAGLLRNEEGVAAIEFALVLPLLIMVLMGSVSIFDLYRSAQRAEKATFTIGDMISRQQIMNAASMTSHHTLLTKLARGSSNTALRVSSITRVNNDFVVQWTKTVGNTATIGTATIPFDVVPVIPAGDSVVLTETFVPRNAIFAGFGVTAYTAHTEAAHRPRFVSAITWQN
jgi:Flp pilus assembly protein TadG